MSDTKVLATLDGKPVRVGDKLYGLDGKRMVIQMNTSRHRDLPMIAVEDVSSSWRLTTREWITDTHFEGVQVLFWEPRTKEQIAEFHDWEEAEEDDKEFDEHRKWVANLTDPDAYMMG